MAFTLMRWRRDDCPSKPNQSRTTLLAPTVSPGETEAESGKQAVRNGVKLVPTNKTKPAGKRAEMGIQDGDQYVIAFEQASNRDVSLIGGKCAGLASLIAAGATVPPGFAVTTRAYLETLAARNLECEIRTRIEAITGTGRRRASQDRGRNPAPDQVGGHSRRDHRRDPAWLRPGFAHKPAAICRWRCVLPAPPKTCPRPVLRARATRICGRSVQTRSSIGCATAGRACLRRAR